MPTYEYRCNACGVELEIEQRMTDPDLVDCTACGAPKLEKLISRPSFGTGSAADKALHSSNPAKALKDTYRSKK